MSTPKHEEILRFNGRSFSIRHNSVHYSMETGLLHETTMSISEIGYSNPAHFTRAFSGYARMTPTAFRLK